MSSAGQWWGAMRADIEERFLGRYSYVSIPEIAKTGGVVIVPLGAVEQHGPHMPLFTDTLIVQSLVTGALEQLPQDHPFYFLYPIAYSYSMEHIDFPGTIALRPETTMQVLMDVANSLARSGFQKVVFLNGHGGNVGLLHVVAREIRIQTGLWVFIVNGGSLGGEPLFDDKEGELGIHAGASETSIMMSQMPHWVHSERVVSEYPALIEESPLLSIEGKFPVAWKTRDISSTGVVGDASQASSTIGDVLFGTMVRNLARVLLEIDKFKGLTATS